MGIDLGRFKSKKNDEWLDWLQDDPVPASLRARMRAKAVQQASRPVVRRVGQQTVNNQEQALKQGGSPNNEPAVSIHISIPKFKKPQFKKLRSRLPPLPKNLTYKHVGIGAGIVALVLGIGFFAVVSKNPSNNKPGATGVLSAADQKPNFSTLTPDKSTKASEKKYNATKKVVSFTDSIGGVDITVSQQALPDAFKKDTDNQVKKLAEGFSANEVLSTANPTAYLGTSIKGPQTVIFAKNNLLVFIQSTKNIDNHDWAEYITNLQ
jgi:hypothetical protein